MTTAIFKQVASLNSISTVIDFYIPSNELTVAVFKQVTPLITISSETEFFNIVIHLLKIIEFASNYLHRKLLNKERSSDYHFK